MKTSYWSRDHDHGEEQAELALPPCAAAMCAAGRYKRSYVVIREEKERLRKELMHLETRVALLRHETGMVAPEVLESKRALGAELRNAALLHDLQFAALQSMFSGFANSPATSPLETCIHLTTDLQQRHDVLLAMRHRKIDVARRFLHERMQFIDPFQECSELSRYSTPQGDFCMTRMEVTLFEGVESVRQVFNVLHMYVANLEISMTEVSGNISVLENDESTETSVPYYRLVTIEHGNVIVESNYVVFLDASGPGCDDVDNQSAIIMTDFVDRDDLFPYRSSERLRKDSTSIMKLSAWRRKRVGVTPAVSAECEGGEEEDELVVALSGWLFVRMRRPEIAVPEPVLRNLADNLTACFDGMIRYIREGLHPSSTKEQSESY